MRMNPNEPNKEAHRSASGGVLQQTSSQLYIYIYFFFLTGYCQEKKEVALGLMVGCIQGLSSC